MVINKIPLFICVFIICCYSTIYAQNNTIKGFAISSFTTLHFASLGYERLISERSSIEFVIQYFADAGDVSTGTISVFPAYRYYIRSENSKLINLTYGSLFGKLQKFSSSGDQADEFLANVFGSGLVIGKLFMLNKKLILDVNFGASYSFRKYVYYYLWDGLEREYKRIDKKADYFVLPRVGLFFGYKF